MDFGGEAAGEVSISDTQIHLGADAKRGVSDFGLRNLRSVIHNALL
jgi:hypothetical protein